MLEYSLDKTMLDTLEKLKELYSFDPKTRCQIHYESPLRFGIPYKYQMAHFYNTGELILARLFDPRYLYNSPEYVPSGWKVSLDNIDYSTIITDLLVEVDRYTGDRFANRGEDMIIQSAILVINQYKNLLLN